MTASSLPEQLLFVVDRRHYLWICDIWLIQRCEERMLKIETKNVKIMVTGNLLNGE